ncbi:MAG TPA: polysaccharide deacetylase family protein [Polyangiaceae bacterium]|jgi:peptidoglycan/xylan/chitin deacetylase (PgdA/CDA1 family)|nr:polysaccharide deacetylase family protein [Polyangiaceae bacterium]
MNALRQLVKRSMMRTLPPWAFLARGPEDSGAVCLTFDDGPHPEHTPALLDVLAREHVPATFFVVGARARAHPNLVRRMAAEGHTVGHHSYSHGDPETTNARILAAEAAETSALLADILSEPPRLFRPPHGKLTVAKLVRLWARGQSIVLWNVDPRDYLHPIVDFFSAQPLQSGDIVLLHDTHPHAAAAIPFLARQAHDHALALTTVSEWAQGAAGALRVAG